MSRIFSVLIVFHFLMLTFGMSGIVLPGSWGSQTQLWYARITGAGGSFGFFSPNVAREFEAHFVVAYPDGREVTTTLHETAAPEARVRIGNMIRLLGSTFAHGDLVRSVAASFAASVFRQYPQAESVTVKLFINDFPSMDQFRAGKRSQLIEIYSAQFSSEG